MSIDFKINHIKFSINSKPVVIAEMSGNHNGSISIAKKIITKAAQSGVDLIKFQTYTPDTMTLNKTDLNYKIKDKNSLWKNQNLYNLYKKAHTPWEWHKELFEYSKKKKLIPFSTPFDLTSLKLLEKLNCKIYKVASFEITDLHLIEHIAKTKKPMLISTGMATFEEIKEAVKIVKKFGCGKFILMKCTSNYPALPENSNLKTITDIKKRFKCNVGLSDHTLGIGAAISAIGYGCVVIEKHLVLDRKKGGVDAIFSLEPNEMQMLTKEVENAWKAKGKIFYGPTKSEIKSLKFRRSLYFVKNLLKGDKITENHISALRPAIGLDPKHYKKILNKRVKKNVKKGTPIMLNLIKN